MMEIIPLAAALGAEIRGIDIGKPLSSDQRDALMDAWHTHLVLLFRDQDITDEQHIRFSAEFGELEKHESYRAEVRHPDHPELLIIKATDVKGAKIKFGHQWHSDLSYTTRPSKGACLRAIHMPPVGGDTMFTNMYLAYETLSAPLREVLNNLEVIHDLTNGGSYPTGSDEFRADGRLRNPAVVQPVVRAHPDTGKAALFVSEWMCTQFAGMTRQESKGLLDYLFHHSTRPEFTFRQRWRLGDVLLWDNRVTQHLALTDYPDTMQRVMKRTSLVGTPLGRLAEAADMPQ